MPTILFVNACARGEASRTLTLSRRLLTHLQETYVRQDAATDWQIQEIHLEDQPLLPLTRYSNRHRS